MKLEDKNLSRPVHGSASRSFWIYHFPLLLEAQNHLSAHVCMYVLYIHIEHITFWYTLPARRDIHLGSSTQFGGRARPSFRFISRSTRPRTSARHKIKSVVFTLLRFRTCSIHRGSWVYAGWIRVKVENRCISLRGGWNSFESDLNITSNDVLYFSASRSISNEIYNWQSIFTVSRLI